MSENRTPLSKLLAAAGVVTALCIGIFVAVALLFGHGLDKVHANVGSRQIMDKNALPPGSYVTFTGVPKVAVAVTSSGKNEALSVFQEQPRLVIFSPNLHPYSREVLASEPESEFFMRAWNVDGRLDIPGDSVCPPDILERFVTKDLGLKSVDEVRILYVNVLPHDQQANLLVGCLCGGVFAVVALISWIAVVVALFRRDDRKVAT